jgi:cation transport ATPase
MVEGDHAVDFRNLPGVDVVANISVAVGGTQKISTGTRKFLEEGVSSGHSQYKAIQKAAEGVKATMIVMIDDEIRGTLVLSDMIRHDAKSVVDWFKREGCNVKLVSVHSPNIVGGNAY